LPGNGASAVADHVNRQRIPGVLLGMMLFIASELMFFGSLFGAYFTIRADTSPWPPAATPEIGALRTAIFSLFLLASSITIQRAVGALKRDDDAGLMKGLLTTIGLGLIFLGGQAWEYSELIDAGFTISTNPFGTLFFTLTGFHGLHVIGGLIAISIVYVSARRGSLSARRHGPGEAVSYYWHFVDVVWVVLFLVLYLLR
jgi:cytochrome c oxidase subunit 3